MPCINFAERPQKSFTENLSQLVKTQTLNNVFRYPLLQSSKPMCNVQEPKSPGNHRLSQPSCSTVKP
ncbi:MAG: hypothetical protein LZF86_50150 [Nitrospira sp.]|nr:MAG: hypothetical protein LZF86_50150 [Nitrospira sp.]